VKSPNFKTGARWAATVARAIRKTFKLIRFDYSFSSTYLRSYQTNKLCLSQGLDSVGELRSVGPSLMPYLLEHKKHPRIAVPNERGKRNRSRPQNLLAALTNRMLCGQC
jgi:hypothetical protein